MKNKSNKEKWASASDARFYKFLDGLILFLLIASVATFILYPLLCIVKNSLFIDGTFTLKEYHSLFKDNVHLLKNSLFVAVLSSACSTLLAAAIALFIHFLRGKTKALLMGMLFVTMVSPPFMSALAYVQLFGRRGMITHDLLGLSLNSYGWFGVVCMQTLFFSSLNALLLVGVLDRLDTSLLQASQDLGAPVSYTVGHIIMPLMRPALIVSFLLSFVRSMSDFGTPMVIGGRFSTLATEIYFQIIGYSDLPKSSAMNVILMIPAVIVFILYRYMMSTNEQLFAGNSNKVSGSDVPFRLRGISKLIIYVSALFFFVMMTLEYGAIFYKAFTVPVRGVSHFSLDNLKGMLSSDGATFVRSIIYALIVGFLGTVIGMLLSYYIERRKIKFGGILDFVITMPYMLPGTCFGIGYILAFNHEPMKLTGTAVIVVINMLFKQLSITTKAATASLAQISTDVDQAARDLGARQFHVAKDIILPNMKNAFGVGFVNNFTSSMITVGAIIFLVSPGQKVAVFTLFDAISSGKYGQASMIATALIAITVVVNVVFSKVCLGERRSASVSRINRTM